MRIFAISGSGIGAGKTTLARKVGDQTWSLAGALRAELSRLYPLYDWENRSQSYKADTKIKECGKQSMRDVMVRHGQLRCEEDELYWVRKLADKLDGTLKLANGLKSIAIDDVRKLSEIGYLKERFPDMVTHLHVATKSSVYEPMFQNDELHAIADYIMVWEK